MVSPEIKRLLQKLSVDILWVYILSLLSKHPAHAYALRKKIMEKFGFLPGNVTSYVVLYKLESRGFVFAKAEHNKKIYRITVKGKKLLEEAKKVFKEKQKIVFG